MIVVKQFAAEFQVQLVVKLVDPFANMLGLHFQIFFVVKSILFMALFSFSVISTYSIRAGTAPGKSFFRLQRWEFVTVPPGRAFLHRPRGKKECLGHPVHREVIFEGREKKMKKCLLF